MIDYLLATRLARVPVWLAFLFFAASLTVGILVMITWLRVTPVHAADESSKKATPSASTGGNGVVASGAVEDTLQACLARIPKVATAGQRMIAEQSCKRDQESRQSIQDVPGR